MGTNEGTKCYYNDHPESAPECFQDLVEKTFAITFTTKLNQSYTTIPIILNHTKNNTILSSFVEPSSNNTELANMIKSALTNLPNYVIDAVDVDCNLAMTSMSTLATAQFYPTLTCTIEFTGSSVMGPQNLLEIETDTCGDGCTPKLATPVQLKSAYNVSLNPSLAASTELFSYVTEYQSADYNAYECGRRGKCDYSSGDCECFEGYTGDRCHTQTALI